MAPQTPRSRHDLRQELDKKDISEIKAMASPPPAVMIVARLSVCLFLFVGGGGRVHGSFNG